MHKGQMVFINLLNELKQDERKKEKSDMSDDLARAYSTDLRYEQYKSGKISEEKYKEYACKRYNTKLRKKLTDDLQKVARVQEAPDLQEIKIACEFNKQHNASCVAEIKTGFNSENGAGGGYKSYEGRASGWGYDKESCAIAEAINQSDSVLKELYRYKEKQLAKGLSDYSHMATDGHDNRYIIGYGAGYDVLPSFEGAVGVECYLRIFDKLGFATSIDYSGKHCNFYHIYKKE